MKNQEKYIREIRRKRKRLLEKKARREQRAEKLIVSAFALAGAGIFFLFFGLYGLAFVGLIAIVKGLAKEIQL